MHSNVSHNAKTFFFLKQSKLFNSYEKLICKVFFGITCTDESFMIKSEKYKDIRKYLQRKQIESIFMLTLYSANEIITS